MVKFKVIAMALSIGAFWGLLAFAQAGGGGHEAHHPGGKVEGSDVRITGEIVDVLCYVKMSATGPQHVKCAESCVKQGVMLGILQAGTGQVYLVFPEGHGNPNEKVMAYIGKQVEVTGQVQAKGGLRGIIVEKISEKQDIPFSLPRPR